MQAPSQPLPSQDSSSEQSPAQNLSSQRVSSHLGSAPGQHSPLGWASDPLGEVRSDMAARRAMNRAAMIAGVGTGLASTIPFMPWIIVAMIAGGGIAVTIYQRRVPASPIAPSRGFRVGLLTGFFGWLTLGLLNGAMLIPSANRALLHRQLAERLADTIRNAPDQASREMMQKLADAIATPSGLAGILILGLFLVGACFLLLGGIGGAIGASVFGKKPQQD
jgi:hypothetical protein